MTETQIQIIAFIRRRVFCLDWLSGCTINTEIGRRNPLQGGQNIIYISPQGKHKIGPYDKDKAKAALYLLVPDECNDWMNAADPEPTIPFKFLWHRRTNSSMYTGLKDSKYCQGFDESSHEKGTLYHQIALDIISIVNGSQPNPQPIWNSIPDIGWIVEAKCLLIKLSSDPDRVKNLLENFNNNDSRVKDLLLLDNQDIKNWIVENSNNGNINLDNLREKLGMDK